MAVYQVMYHYQMTIFCLLLMDDGWYHDILRKFVDKIYFALDTGHYEPNFGLSRQILD